MTPRNRTPNDLLRALLKEARWTGHNFSLAVNRVAADAGARLHYDRTSVSHWLSGTRPHPPVPAFAAEALTRRLGRPVSVAETGMADPTAEDLAPAPFEQDSGPVALHRLLHLDLDPRRRTALHEQPFRIDWSVVPRWRGRRRGPLPPADPGRGTGAGRLAALNVMTSAFTTADQAFGGGHARSALVTYLANDVVGWLRSASTGRGREQLVSGSAVLTHLVGSMCFDDLRHHLAQRYYRVALRLVDEVDDSTGHALVLRRMSTQAHFLGHYRHAARLADAAADRVGTSAPPGTCASLLGRAAVAHAALSDSRAALTRLAKAERHLEKADDTRQPTGRTDRADVEHLAGQALLFLRDHRHAEIALHESLRHRPEGERRSRLLTTHQLAELQLRQAHPEQACATWQRFLDECSWVDSGRVRAAAHAFRVRLQPYSANTSVHRVLRRTERLTGRAAGPPDRVRDTGFDSTATPPTAGTTREGTNVAE